MLLATRETAVSTQMYDEQVLDDIEQTSYLSGWREGRESVKREANVIMLAVGMLIGLLLAHFS